MKMEPTMEMWVEKANVLIEALPYIRRFHGKTIVVKYGGSAMIDTELKQSVIRDVALLKLVGFKPVVVHGGGKDITRWINKIGLETNFVNGLRVTDKPTMEIVEMVLNKINKDLVSMMEHVGLKAVGISGKDGRILRVERKLAGDKDIGFVGEIQKVNTELLKDFAASGIRKDILTHIFIPGGKLEAAYLSQRNSATDFPVLTCAVVRREGKVACAVGACPARAARFDDEAGLLAGGVNEESAAAFAGDVARRAVFGSNTRGSAEYRREVCRALVSRAALKLEEK